MKRLCLLLAALTLLIGACEIRKPVLPEWDVTLNVPLMYKKFFVSDLVDSVNIFVGDGDVLTLRGTGSIDTPPFGEVNFNPGINATDVPLITGPLQQARIPFGDPDGLVELSYGELKTGFIRTRFTGISNQVDELSITIQELTTQQGQPFQISYTGNSGWNQTSLVGCRVGVINSGQILDSLTVVINVQPSLPANTPIGSMDFVLNEPVSFELFQGRLNNHNLPLQDNATTITIDYPYGIEDAIELQEARMMISIQNQLGFFAEFHGTMFAENTRTGETRTIPILDNNGNAYVANPSTPTGPGLTDLIFENNVSTLLQIMPDKISINDAYFNVSSVGGAIGTVRDTDGITGNYQVDAPFTFELFESTIKLQDPVRIDISEDNRRRIQDNALGAELQLLIKNMLPIGVTANLYFGNTDTIDPENPATWILQRTAALHSKQWVEAHPNDPSVNANGEQLIDINLSEAEVDIFANPNVFLLWTFSFEASNGVVSVTASPADYIQVKSMIKVGLRIQEEI